MNRRTFFKALLVTPAAVAAVVKAEAAPKYVVAIDPGLPDSERSGRMIFVSTPGDNTGWFYREWQRGFNGQNLHVWQ
jgi:hypothetical protein